MQFQSEEENAHLLSFFQKRRLLMHILVSTTTASDLAETAEQSIDYIQKIVDYMISKAHILISALIILMVGW